MLRRHRWLTTVVILLIAAALGAGIFFYLRRTPEAATVADKEAATQAPPDLAKLRTAYRDGLAALQNHDAPTAIRHLSSFDFGSRNVEDYRLFRLAEAYKAAGNQQKARATLATLWRRDPNFVLRDDAGFALSSMYWNLADWRHAASVAEAVARRAAPEPAAEARWKVVEAAFAAGQPGRIYDAARRIAIQSARADEADAALAVLRSMEGKNDGEAITLSPEHRLERAVSLMRDGDAASAFDDLTALEPDAPPALVHPIRLNRGLALHHMRRFEDSNRVLEPLASSYYKYAVPAIYHAAKNYRVLAASIDIYVFKTITERKQVGTVKTRVGKGKKRRTVTKPKFADVKKTVKLVDLAKKAKKETYERLSTERLKDVLSLPAAPAVRAEVLKTLAQTAQAKKQTAYLQQLVPEIIKIEPAADPGLQYFWDKAWSAYARGDLHGAAPLLLFIRNTYNNTNVQRQSEYWYARTLERRGEKQEAAAIYSRLASAPYEDLYAVHAQRRGAKRAPTAGNPLKGEREDWPQIAEKSMPRELRLAYELTALSDMKHARLEIQKNMSRDNARFAEALLTDLYHSTGNRELMYRSIRRAFPQLATVEQDSTPAYFLRKYYPVKYDDTITKYATQRNLDPHLVRALILQESYFNPRARSPVGATGLMQIMPPTGKEIWRRLHGRLSSPNLEDPHANIEIGTWHLRMLLNMFGGTRELAVASYNAGQGNVLKWRRAAPGKPIDEFVESIPFDETRNYVKRVTLLRSTYARLGQ